MGWDIGGRKDIIKKITREDFVEYMGSLYSAGNISVIIAGGIDPKKAVSQVEQYFGGMKSFETKSPIDVVEKQAKPEVLLRQKTTEQVHISLGVRTVPIDNDEKYALSILSSMLGGGMSSRLFHEVREKRGLAYYVRTSSDHYTDVGTLVSTAGVDPKRVDEAISVIIAEYDRIRSKKNGITDKEISKAKEYIKGHTVLELEDSRAVAAFYGMQEVLEDEVENPEKYIKEIDGVSIGDVEKVAQKYLINSTLNLAVIGNFEDRQRFEKLLKL